MGRPRSTTVLRAADTAVATLPKTLRGLVRAKGTVADPLRDFVRRIPGGKKAVYALLQHCADDEDAKVLVTAWDHLTRTVEGARVTNVDLREVLDHADRSPREFVGIVTRCAWEFNIEAARGIFAMRYPKMMEASMKRAEQNEATAEREIHFKATGHVPTPKGIQIAMQQNNSGDRAPEPGEAPAVGRTARRIVRDLPPAD